MTFALILLGTVAACFVLRNPIKRWPMLFYILAVAVDLVFIVGVYGGLPRALWSVFLVLIQKCTLPLALFIVVMYLGVFSRTSKPYLWLKPIRSELSIIAWILSLGHMAIYLASYVPRMIAGGSLNANVLWSFVLAIVLLVLLIILGVTSFNVVKKHLHTETWKKVQKLAYPFFLLVYVHVLLMLLPSALHGGIASSVTVGVYSVVFIAYVVLRLARALKDHREQEAS